MILKNIDYRLPGTPPANVKQKSVVKQISNSTIVFMDDSKVVADVFLFCTGYEVDLPFIDNNTGLTVHENFVHPLYRDIVNVKYPQIGFIGLPSGILPFPTFHVQVINFL